MYRSMQWKGNYYKAGLREGHCLQVVEKVKEEGNNINKFSLTSSSSSSSFSLSSSLKIISFIILLLLLSSSSSSSSSVYRSSSIICTWWLYYYYCAKREILYKYTSLLACKQSSNREINFSREGSTSPTLMGYKPIQSGDSYDVIRGGHRHIWFVRR